LISLTLFVTGTQKRRRYYIGNFVTITLNIIAGVGAAIYTLPKVAAFKIEFLTQVNFEELKTFAELFNSTYTESTFWFDAANYAFGFLLLTDLALVCNLVLKLVMMKKEKELIEQGKEAK
nr:hypothetical protein [Lachnospiraceae bacterium]